MKKLLGIVVVSLLLSGNAYAVTVSDYVFEGMSKKQLKKLVDPMGFTQPLYKTEEFNIVGGTKDFDEWGGYAGSGGKIVRAMCNGYDHKINKNGHKYFSKFKTEVFTHPAFISRNHMGSKEESLRMLKILPGIPWYVFENVTKPIKCTYVKVKVGNGTLKGIAWSKEEAYAIASPEFKKEYSDVTFPTREEQIEIAKKTSETQFKTKIAEKPKEKKTIPKQSPEDNKVVPAGSGSGFFVSRDGHIITNHHVIDGCNTTKVSFKGNQLDARILAVDKKNDIAIIKVNIKPNSFFPISNEDVSLLEDVVVAGYPLGKQVSSAIKTHKGVVTALAGAGDNYSNFQTDASINAGNSGGPIMNQKGNIVGIAVATWVQEGVQGVHFGIKSSTLKTFANSNSLKFSQANNRELSNKDLGKLITEATVYLECHMTVAKIKRMIAEANNQKAFFSEFK